ncbi:MAG: 2,3-diphosphoglycerate synthetase [Actinomycetota bacterium]|nr:2,3-diphosphoglycerate synthetase [Actinomycetota bacterium]
MIRVLVLVDGEHYPPVVQAAIAHLATLVPGADVVGAVLLGGGEKLAGTMDIGIPVVEGVAAGLARFSPDLVFDLSDEPVVDARTRLRLASQVLLAGIPYQGADFRLDPPPRPRVATKPTVAVVGTGKRTGKTAVSAHLARVLAADGRPPVIVAMGRGGPPEPELIDPAAFDLTPDGLVALAASGRHAASDHLEDALMAGVVTVGTRRCGGGMAGAPVESTVPAGVELANGRPEPLLVLEGSGAAIPPVHADATVCVVPATTDPELVTGYLGPYRLLLADLLVVTMAEPSSGKGGLDDFIRSAGPRARVVRTVLRPAPLEPITGRSVFYVTTAPAAAGGVLVEHLEAEHGAKVVGVSHNLARRPELAADLENTEGAEILLVELKAAAVDVVARLARQRDLHVVFCDNRVVTTGGDGTFEDLVLETATLAEERFALESGGQA